MIPTKEFVEYVQKEVHPIIADRDEAIALASIYPAELVGASQVLHL